LTTQVPIRHDNGAGWGRVLPSPSPTLIYLPCPYPTGKRNWITSPSPMGSGIPSSSPSPQWINFFNKKRVFLRFNRNFVMHYPTICAHFNIYLPNNSVAPLTINESSYIMTIIKPNNMTYHHQPPQQKQKHDLSAFG